MANNQITPFQLTDQFTMDNFNQRINETNIALQNKADLGENGKVPAEQVDAYSQSDSISAETRTALSLPETATPDAALAEIARKLSESGGVTMTLLWENASPTSDFAAQTINLDWSSYDLIFIDCSQSSVFKKPILNDEFDIGFIHCWAAGDWEIQTRMFKTVSSGIEIRDSYSGRYTSVGTANRCVIPRFIYGIKMS